MFASFRRQKFGFAWLLLIFGVSLSAFSLASRARHDASPDAVRIALEWKEATRLADGAQIPLERWLKVMRVEGARGAIVDVPSIRELSEDGRLNLLGRDAATPLWPGVGKLPRAYRYVIVCDDAALLRRIHLTLSAQKMVAPPRLVTPDVLAVALKNEALSSWPIGLDTATVAALRRAQIEPVARLADWQGVTPTRLNGLFGQLRADGVRIVIVGAGSASVSAPGAGRRPRFPGLGVGVERIGRAPKNRDAPRSRLRGDTNFGARDDVLFGGRSCGGSDAQSVELSDQVC